MLFLIIAMLMIPAFVSAESWPIFDPTEIFSPPSVSGTTWYVDGKSGSDSTGDGSLGKPWKTIGKAFDRYSGRDPKRNRVLVKGGVYTEMVNFPDNWKWGAQESDRFVLAAYDNTPVIINRGIQQELGAWTIYSGSIYQATFTNAHAALTGVIIDDDFKSYRPKTSLGDVKAPGNWYYNSANRTLYVWTPASVGNPAGRSVIVVEDEGDSSMDACISFGSGARFITVSGLVCQASRGHGIYNIYSGTKSNGLTIDRNVVRYCAKGGMYMKNGDNMQLTRNHVYGNIMRNWPRGRWNNVCANINSGGWPSSMGISGGAVVDGAVNGLVSGNIIHDNGGEGTGNGIGTNGITIRYNIVYDNWSVGIYLDQAKRSRVHNNFLYSTGVPDFWVADHCTTTDEINRIKRRIRQEGIMTADEKYGGIWDSASFDNAVIYNNLIVGCRRGITHYAWAAGSGFRNSVVANNTIVVPDYAPTAIGENYVGLKYSANGGNNVNSVIRNNIVYAVNPDTQVAMWPYVGEANDRGIAWSNNLYYHAGSTTPFSFKGGLYNFTNWKQQTGQDTNSFYEDPKFQGASLVYR